MRAIYTILVLIAVHYGYAQQVQEFLFTPKEEKKFIPISTEQKGKYLQLTFADTSIQKLFQDKNILEYRKAFPNLKSYLNTVYLLRVENSSLNLTSLLKNKFITYGEKMEEATLAMEYPNDFMLPDGSPNDYLELIRAPLAWSLTKGDPDILIGIVDSWFNTVHEELADKIVGIYGPVPTPAVNISYSHEIEVSSLAAGDTNNGKGLSSIGYNTRIVGHYGSGITGVYALSQIPGVKVINMSWSILNFSQYENDLCAEIHNDLDIVLVGAAGNGRFYFDNFNQFRYQYPASYDAVISVTGVGSK